MIIVREFQPSDLNRVYEVEAESFKDPYHPIFLMNLHYMYKKNFLVALKNGLIVGYVIGRKTDSKGHIIAIAISNKYRRQNLGKLLIDAEIESLRNLGIKEIFLEVRTTNVEAILFYKKMGFVESRILEGYYSDGEDAILFKKLFYY